MSGNARSFPSSISGAKLLLLCVWTAGAADLQGQASDPRALGRGLIDPGEYRVRCDVEASPADAVDVSVGLATRAPTIGELGTVTSTRTEVRRKGPDGRFDTPNLVRPSDDGEGCVVRLDRHGTYEVRVERDMTRWQWKRSEWASSVSVERAHTEPLTGKKTVARYHVFVRGNCSEGEIADPQPETPDPVRGRFEEGLVRALAAKGQPADEHTVTTESTESAGLWRFAVRLGPGGCVLPSIDAMLDCSAPMARQATHMLFGALQVVGGKSRVTARIVEVETGLILTAAKGDAPGSGIEDFAKAATDALDGMDYAWDCR